MRTTAKTYTRIPEFTLEFTVNVRKMIVIVLFLLLTKFKEELNLILLELFNILEINDVIHKDERNK